MHDKSIPPLAQIALLHYQFEAIHPFLDGNGRVGRLLIILFLIERSILPSPLLYISAFFEATRRDYYDRLRGVSEQGNWSAWLEYFLNGIARQSEDALSRSERINQKIMDWRKEFSGASSKVPLKLIDILASNPYLTITKASQRLEVAYTTIERAIKKLENLSVVTKVGKAKRDRVYCASSILEILDEPAKLTVSREL